MEHDVEQGVFSGAGGAADRLRCPRIDRREACLKRADFGDPSKSLYVLPYAVGETSLYAHLQSGSPVVREGETMVDGS